MSGFIQVMEIHTSRYEELDAFTKKMEAERGDALLARRVAMTADRDRPGYYFIIVEFDSYEEAMRNSTDPETGRYAQEMASYLDAPPVFHNLDVREIINRR